MTLLMNDEFAPITSKIGFVEAPLHFVVEAFWKWQLKLRQDRADGLILEKRLVAGTIRDVIQALQPLQPLKDLEPRHYLFVPTKSPWIAYFDNGRFGTDPFSMVSYLSNEIHCRGLVVTAIPDTINKIKLPDHGRYGAVKLEVYGPEKTDWLNLIRSIGVWNEGEKWVFMEHGTPFPFENTDKYRSMNIQDRFTFDMLESYLKNLGLSPFDEYFYLPENNNKAVLILLKDK